MSLAWGVLSGGGVCARVDGRVVDMRGVDPLFDAPSLNALMAAGPEAWRQARERVDEGNEVGDFIDDRLGPPFEVADYVDFYSSLHHATNLGRMFRPDAEPLLPNWRHLPVGYHGRAGTVVPSGTPVRRPQGPCAARAVVVRPCRRRPPCRRGRGSRPAGAANWA